MVIVHDTQISQTKYQHPDHMNKIRPRFNPATYSITYSPVYKNAERGRFCEPEHPCFIHLVIFQISYPHKRGPLGLFAKLVFNEQLTTPQLAHYWTNALGCSTYWPWHIADLPLGAMLSWSGVVSCACTVGGCVTLERVAVGVYSIFVRVFGRV